MPDYSRDATIGKYHEEETVREVLEDVVGNSAKLTKEAQEESLEELKKLKTGIGLSIGTDLDKE